MYQIALNLIVTMLLVAMGALVSSLRSPNPRPRVGRVSRRRRSAKDNRRQDDWMWTDYYIDYDNISDDHHACDDSCDD